MINWEEFMYKCALFQWDIRKEVLFKSLLHWPLKLTLRYWLQKNQFNSRQEVFLSFARTASDRRLRKETFSSWLYWSRCLTVWLLGIRGKGNQLGIIVNIFFSISPCSKMLQFTLCRTEWPQKSLLFFSSRDQQHLQNKGTDD